MKTLALIVLATLLNVPRLPAQDGEPENPVMLRYRETYQQSLKSASAAYNDAITNALKVYHQALDNLTREVTRSGNLEAAVALRKEREKTLADAPLLFDGHVPTPSGAWKVVYSNGYKWNYVIDKNGKATGPRGSKATLSIEKDAYHLEFGDAFERLTFSPYRLFIERWAPGSGFAAGKPPTEFGIGTPVTEE